MSRGLALLCQLALAFSACRCESPRGTEPGLGIAPFAGGSLRDAFESLPAGGDVKVTPLFGNVEAWAARWRLVDGARESIDVVTFILHDDLFGRSFLGLLARKADEGVEVRLLVDATGSVGASGVPRQVLEALDAHPRVEVRVYNPIESAVPDVVKELSLLPAVAANHDKIIIVDRKRAIIGGRNFADEYFADPADDPVVFTDKDALFEGAAVAEKLRVAFERELLDGSTTSITEGPRDVKPGDDAQVLAAARAMDKALRERPVPKAELPPPVAPSRDAPVPEARELPDDAARAVKHFPRMLGALRKDPPRSYRGEARILDSCSQAGCRKNDINEGLARLVAAARHEVIIENPYLMLSAGGLDVLRDAGRRGVRITLLTNSPVSSDNAITQAFFLEQWPTILAAVPNMRIYVMAESHNVHGKLVTIDGVVTAIGSYNLDVLSAAMNSEVVGVIWSKDLAAAARANVTSTIARGAPHVYEYTIARTADGTPILDDNGEPSITFGAQQHCDPERWTQLSLLRKAMAVRDAMPDLSPLL